MNGSKTKAASGRTAPSGTTRCCGSGGARFGGGILKKGGKVYIEGRLQTRSWDDKTSGQKKYMTEVVASDLILLGGRGEGEGAGDFKESSHGASAGSNGGNNFDQRMPEPEHANAGSGPITDEDIPF